MRLLLSVSTSPGDLVFVDHQGLNEQLTSSAQTARRGSFRNDVIRRDGPACVVTKAEKADCDAAHLIPHSKGDEVRFVVSSFDDVVFQYIMKVMRLRSPEGASARRIGINMTENGIFLRKDLHSMLARGQVALIKV